MHKPVSGDESAQGNLVAPGTIEFQVCPYHEPHPAGFERTLVVDTFTRRFKCAACNAEGTLLANGELPIDVAIAEVVKNAQA